MSDIVPGLRNMNLKMADLAADEIDRLRAEVGRLKRISDESLSMLAAIFLGYDPSETLWDLRKRGVAILRERDRYRDALERLARLGNGNLPGNSDGNVIAQDALTGREAG